MNLPVVCSTQESSKNSTAAATVAQLGFLSRDLWVSNVQTAGVGKLVGNKEEVSKTGSYNLPGYIYSP